MLFHFDTIRKRNFISMFMIWTMFTGLLCGCTQNITDTDINNFSDTENLISEKSENIMSSSAVQNGSFTAETKIREVINYSAFEDYGRLIFPVNESYYRGDTLGELNLTWYTEIRPEKTVEICNYMKNRVDSGETIFYNIYTDEEKAADPSKNDTGLFFFKGKPGAKFAVCNSGGGMVYVGSMHDSFPHALEISNHGYNAFACIYRAGYETGPEDCARAVKFIFDHAEELEVDTSDYSLWGGSAGARIADWVGTNGTAYYGQGNYPQAAAVIMQYTALSEVTGNEPPTYNCVGTNDGIAPYKTMQERIDRIKANGTDTMIEVFTGLSHGFGIGTGTVAEGWVDNAISFWERNMKESDTNISDDIIIKTAGSEINVSDLAYKTDSANAPVVYYSSDISAEGLLKLYQALDWTPSGNVAVKVSTGESENTNYLRPTLIKDLVQELDGTVVECMTAYGGVRSQPESHHQIAEEHGFTAIAPFDLMDEDGEKEIPFENGERLNKAVIGTHTDNYEDFLVLSHFKGHAMAGYGGALKNVSIGISSVSGKIYIHSGGERTEGSIMGGEQNAFLESLAEATKAISDYIGTEHMIYISVMNRLSVDCDCDANPAEPDMHDIGILASTDPVALDQACIDFVYASPDSDSLKERIESRNGIHALEHAEKINLGNRDYQLINIDNGG